MLRTSFPKQSNNFNSVEAEVTNAKIDHSGIKTTIV
jgi:hypothetical protein